MSSRGLSSVAITILAVLTPLLFGGAIVLERYALTPTSVEELWRALPIVLLLAALLLVILSALPRSLSWGSVLASLAILALLSHVVPALVVLAIAVWWPLVNWLRRRSRRATRRLGVDDLPVRMTSLYSVLLAAFGIWMAISTTPASLGQSLSFPVPAAAGGPDIYVVILDGYPRTDTLEREFGFDNRAFEDQLSGLGFSIAGGARANYNKTWLSVSSLLNGQYVHQLPAVADPPEDAPAQTRLAHQLINSGQVLEYLRGRGYEVVSIPSPVLTGDVTQNADVKGPLGLSSFEIALVTPSLPGWLVPGLVLDFLADDARQLTSRQLSMLSELTAPVANSPRMVLTHLMPPHPPFVLGQDPDYLRDCFPRCKLWETTVEETGMSEGEYASRLRMQVTELNEMVAPAIADVVSANPDAIVIVMSDHGARHHSDATEEHFDVFLAARTPDAEDALPEDISVVNVFRRVLSSTFDESLPDLPYEAWASDWFTPLTLTRFQ
jgi:hypothetical protein